MTTTDSSDGIKNNFTLNLDGLEQHESPLKSPKHKVGNKIASLAKKFEQKVGTNQQGNSSFLSARERDKELEDLKKTKGAYSSLHYFSGLIEKKKKEDEEKKNKWNAVKSALDSQQDSPPPERKEKSAPTSPKKTKEHKKSVSTPSSSMNSPKKDKIPQERTKLVEEEEPTKVLKNQPKGLTQLETNAFQNALQSLEVKMKPVIQKKITSQWVKLLEDNPPTPIMDSLNGNTFSKSSDIPPQELIQAYREKSETFVQQHEHYITLTNPFYYYTKTVPSSSKYFFKKSIDFPKKYQNWKEEMELQISQSSTK